VRAGRRKNFRRHLQGKSVSAPPAHQVGLLGMHQLVHLVVIDRLSRATTKKVVNFFEEKSAPIIIIIIIHLFAINKETEFNTE